MRLADLVQAFPMRVIYHSRNRNPNAPAHYEYFANVEEMLAQTDVLSVHVPLRPDTVGLVGEKWIRALKPKAVIINTARGKVIDEDALIRALEDGHVSASCRDSATKMVYAAYLCSRLQLLVWTCSQMSLR